MTPAPRRPRRRTAIAAVLAAVLVALAAVPANADAATRKKRAPCSAKGSVTMLATERARIYRVGEDEFDVYGCLYRVNRRHLLTSYFDCDCSRADDQPPGLWLAGDYVAYNPWSCSPVDFSCFGRVVSRRLTRISLPRFRIENTARVSDLVLRPNGSIAFIQGPARDFGETRLRAFDSSGERWLDTGPGIEPESLGLSRGGRLYWKKGGAPFTALLD